MSADMRDHYLGILTAGLARSFPLETSALEALAGLSLYDYLASKFPAVAATPEAPPQSEALFPTAPIGSPAAPEPPPSYAGQSADPINPVTPA